MNRRRFLNRSALVSGAVLSPMPASLAKLPADNRYRREIGVQLYTLRNEIKKDADATIKAVVDAGYHQGEMYGFPNCDPMIAAARNHGLALHSSHFEWGAITSPKDGDLGPFKAILDKAKEVGLSHLVVPYLHDHERKDLDAYRRLAENLNKGAMLAKEAGIRLAYHNHAFEFQPMEAEATKSEKCGFDIFIKEFSPDMQFEIDVFWIQVADRDPVKLVESLSGRVSQLHLKDLAKGTELPSYAGVDKDRFEELGDGMIPMEPIIQAAAAAGVDHCHVEQDHSPHPLKSIQQSMAHLRSL